MPPESSDRPFSLAAPPAWFLAILVFLVTTLAYLPVWDAGFVWNDPDYVTHPALRSWFGLWHILFVVGSTEQHYPLLHGLFWVENRLWGEAALGYHLVNVAFHAGSACLFALILRRLAVPGAWFAAFLFALHPICVESVAWVSEQKNTLSTILYLAAALAYVRYDDDRRERDYRIATILYALALFAKSLTATLPAALLVVFWWRRGRLSWRRDVVPLLPWFVAGAAMGLFSSWVEHNVVGASGPDFDLTPLQRLIVASRSTLFYLYHTFWPTNLVFIYPRWHVDPANLRQWLFPAAAVALTIGLWLVRRRSRAPLATWLFFAGSLFPVSGCFSLYAYRYSFIADHWQYQPILGPIAFAAGTLAWLAAKYRAELGAVTPAAAALLLALFGVLSWRATLPFHDLDTFYKTILERNPGCWMASTNLGNVYLTQGQNDEAITQFQNSIRYRSDLPGVYFNIGDAYLAKKDFSVAIDYYLRAEKIDPNVSEIHNNLGSAYMRLGRVAEALEEFQRALKLRPDYAEAHNNLGYLLTQYGQPQAAIEHFHRALAQQRNYPEAQDNLGSALLQLGRIDAAISCYREALRLNPKFDTARNNLGNAYARAGRTDEAVACYREVLRHNGADISALINLGNLYVQTGRAAESLPGYESALQLAPEMPEAHNNYGYALLRLGRTSEAIVQFQRALALRPEYPDARNNLALAQSGTTPAATP
ncbi:MAG TPA: tetratricopeptide repeat protein [Opitutus sp.]|nr:tetratricopeptide repeat protein [Opitutus sp.]